MITQRTAAGMMEGDVVSIPVQSTVGEAIRLLRDAPRPALHYLYVTDPERRLSGVLGMRDLLLARPDDPIAPMVRGGLTTVRPETAREEVASVMQRSRYLALPVVDAEGRLQGVVRHDRVLGAIQEEAFEDLRRMVGAGGDEHALAPVGEAVRKRLGWLVVNLATAFLASAVIAQFGPVLAKVAALSVLMSIVAGQGGNTGAQTLAVVIRGLAVREIIPGSAWRLVRKELIAGFLNGIVVAAVTGAVVYLWFGRGWLAFVIGMAMVVNMAAATLSGAAIPLALAALGRDPAQSSSIFMTTVTDVVGYASFLGFALLFIDKLV
jgi:magnesium transporter